jgi:hypothetical protein
MSGDVVAKATEISADLLEPAVDALLRNPILKDIPLLGLAVRLASLGKSISDRIFLAKVQRFLDAVRPGESAEARQFAQDLESGEEDAVRTAQVLLVALESMNDLEKAPIHAAVFTAFLRGMMTRAQFRRLTWAVDAAVVDDLWAFAAVVSGSGEMTPDVERGAAILNALQHTGFADSPTEVSVYPGSINLTAAVTPLGRMLAAALAGFRTDSAREQQG